MFHESRHRATSIQRRALPSLSVSRKSNKPEAVGANALIQRIGNQGVQRLIGAKTSSDRQSAPAVQRKLTVSEPGDIHEQEADRMANGVMRMADPEPAEVHSRGAAGVQRMCSACDEELEKKQVPTVQRKEGGGGAPVVTRDVAANIQAMRGGGSELPASTRALFEPRFGANFGQVRVHTDTHAARTARSINAKAFTVGRDIAFASGQYSPNSGEGQRLLAHELTHVVQQGGSDVNTIQRDDEQGAQPDVDTPAGPAAFSPEQVVLDLLELLELDDFADLVEDQEEIPEEDLTEEEKQFQQELDHAMEWLGTGARAKRKVLLLRTEDIRLQTNPGYRESLIAKFGSEAEPNEAYLGWLLEEYDKVSTDEKGTMSRLNLNMPALKLDEYYFVDNPFIWRWNGGNAFPDFSWNIVQPLISPSQGLRSSVASDRSQTQTALDASWGHMGWDLYHNGIPASFMRSLSITQYSTIKSKPISKLLTMPDRPWLYDHLIMPEETDLHTEVMRAYTGHVISNVLAELQHSILEKWSSATLIKWGYYDAFAISSFRLQHPSGMNTVADFYNYSLGGAGLGASLAKIKVDRGIHTTGVNPYLFLSRVSADAQGAGPNLLKQLNAFQLEQFKNVVANADSKIAGLEAGLRLATAVEWSIKKGFAGEGIAALRENLDTILFEILKEYAKDKAVKKAIMVGVGWLGPWGRAISIIYNIWEFFDDARDKIETALLVKSFLDLLDTAKDSQKVVTTQQASAKLAQAYADTFQRLIQKLGSKLLSKVSAKTAKAIKQKWKKGDKMSDAERAENIHQSRREDDARKLEPQFLHAEVETALKSKFTKSSDADYDAEVAIGNSHVWRRLKGTNIWCRSTDRCIAPTLDPETTKQLNEKANKEVPATGAGTGDQHQPAVVKGKAPRSPEEVTDFLSKAGLETSEIIGFGKADASKLSKSDAARVAMLSEHFTAADLKALGSYLFKNNKVLTDARAKKLIDNIRPGGMQDFLNITRNPEIGQEQGQQIIDIDPDAGIRVVELRTRPKSNALKSPANTPLWRLAELQALPALQAKFGDDGWEISPRVKPEGAAKGENLGSTIPEYRKGNQVFEVKRFHLDQLGISEDGRIIGPPSKSSVEALVRARGQLATRESLIAGATQNIIFNITGQGSAANAAAIGKQIQEILKKNNISYGKVWVQVTNELTPID